MNWVTSITVGSDGKEYPYYVSKATAKVIGYIKARTAKKEE